MEEDDEMHNDNVTGEILTCTSGEDLHTTLVQVDTAEMVETPSQLGLVLPVEELHGMEDDRRKELLKDLGRGPVCHHHMLIHEVWVAHLHHDTQGPLRQADYFHQNQNQSLALVILCTEPIITNNQRSPHGQGSKGQVGNARDTTCQKEDKSQPEKKKVTQWRGPDDEKRQGTQLLHGKHHRQDRVQSSQPPQHQGGHQSE